MSVDPFAPPNAPNAVAALVLGILGLVLCPLLGPVAWILGRKGQEEIDSSGGAVGGRGLATTGKVLGMVGTFLLALLIAVGVALLAGGPTAP